MSAVSFTALTPSYVDYIYSRLREPDRCETIHSGVGDVADALPELAGAEVARCALVDGEPVAMYGFALGRDAWVDTIWAFFIGTPVVDRHPITLNRLAKRFLRQIRETYPGRPVMTAVWEGYVVSVRWLKYLRFVETGQWIGVAPNRLLVMELDDQTRTR